MAEPARLHSLGLHYGLRVLSAVFGSFAAVIVTQTLLSGERRPVAFVAMGTIALTVAVFSRVVWATRPMLIDGDALLIGRGARRRRVAFSDVLSCAHPWWVFSDRLAAPLELNLRGGATVTFFPEIGAAELIAARRRG